MDSTGRNGSISDQGGGTEGQDSPVHRWIHGGGNRQDLAAGVWALLGRIGCHRETMPCRYPFHGWRGTEQGSVKKSRDKATVSSCYLMGAGERTYSRCSVRIRLGMNKKYGPVLF